MRNIKKSIFFKLEYNSLINNAFHLHTIFCFFTHWVFPPMVFGDFHSRVSVQLACLFNIPTYFSGSSLFFNSGNQTKTGVMFLNNLVKSRLLCGRCVCAELVQPNLNGFLVFELTSERRKASLLNLVVWR